MNNAAACIANCSKAVRYLSYERLQKNEASKRVKHPVIKAFEVNFLGSNSPIEDRFAVGFSPTLGIGLFSVIDGHKGFRCSNFIQNHLLQYVTDAISGAPNSDVEVCMTMNQTFTTEEPILAWKSDNIPTLSTMTVEEILTSSFNALEALISSEALNDVKLILQGHSMGSEMKERILQAIEGACVTLAMVHADIVSVATTGDCRVVVGRENRNEQSWQAVPISSDQNAMNADEVERLRIAHPGEDVVINGRVLGSLMPFRTFGDVDFKWDVKYLKAVVPIWPNYLTPPYITAKPVVTHHKKVAGDRFMIIASDGLWERLSNEEAVNIVANANTFRETGKHGTFSLLEYFSKGRSTECCPPNAATQLLWHALGGTDEKVLQLLDVPPGYSRMVRDDITIIVVHFQ